MSLPQTGTEEADVQRMGRQERANFTVLRLSCVCSLQRPSVAGVDASRDRGGGPLGTGDAVRDWLLADDGEFGMTTGPRFC